MQHSDEDSNPQLRIVLPSGCSTNPLASPLAAAAPASASKMPTSTTKGLASFSLNRSKRGELTALDPQQPSKRIRSPEGLSSIAEVSNTDGTRWLRQFTTSMHVVAALLTCHHVQRPLLWPPCVIGVDPCCFIVFSCRHLASRYHERRHPMDGWRGTSVGAAKARSGNAPGAAWWACRRLAVRAVCGGAHPAAWREWFRSCPALAPRPIQ